MRVRVDASRLTQWIRLEAPPPPPGIPDGEGGYIDTPQPLAPPTDWAAIEPVSSTTAELPVAGSIIGALTHHVLLRYRPDITLKTQLTFVDQARRTRRLYVRSLQAPLEQAELLHLWCEEQVA